jgi:large subunit ribosomal protein L9
MQVILIKDVDTLGSQGDVVEVAGGFYRNYLEPRKLVVKATERSLEDLRRRIDRIRAKAEKKHQDDLSRAQAITDLTLLILEANAGEGGKLYGTITTKQLAEVLQEKTGLTLERRNVNVDRPINRTGDYTINIKFSSRVSTQLALQVNAIRNQHEEEEFLLEEAFAGAEEE